jgi:hypothetical protein
MFALLAALCFLAMLLKLHLGGVDLEVLGWFFVALHLLLGVPLVFWRPKQQG